LLSFVLEFFFKNHQCLIIFIFLNYVKKNLPSFQNHEIKAIVRHEFMPDNLHGGNVTIRFDYQPGGDKLVKAPGGKAPFCTNNG